MKIQQLLPFASDFAFHVIAVEDLSNNKDVLEKIMNLPNHLGGVMVDASLIVSSFHLFSAVYKATSATKLKTKTVATEILYQCSPSKNIGESLKLFGAKDASKNYTFILFFPLNSSTSTLADLDSTVSTFCQEYIKCNNLISNWNSYSDLDSYLQSIRNKSQISQIFKVSQEQIDSWTPKQLEENIVSKISVKDL